MINSINRNRPTEPVQAQLDLAQAIARQQAAISSGKRITQPSDDPQGWLEVSLLARQQGNEGAWTANISRAETRAVQAESSMGELSNGLIRAKELIVQANNDAISSVNREGIAIELEGILSNFRDILGQDDPFGGKLFAGVPIEVPIGGSRNVIAAPTLARLSQGISDGSGGSLTIEGVVQAAIDAARSGTNADREASLTPLDTSLDHIASMLTEQGVARGRLESARSQFTESGLVLVERRKSIEEVNISEAITRLQALDISLQAAQAVYAKITQRSLMDYLR